MFPPECLDAARDLLSACRARSLRLATAESCTGGLIAGCLTELPGSSDVVARGYVVYDNAAKEALLGVRPTTLADRGAVSERTAREMAEGALRNGQVGLAVAVTGIAGPGGGTATKPVGLVHLAASRAGGATLHERHLFPGDRSAVRLASVGAALRLARRALEASPPAA